MRRESLQSCDSCLKSLLLKHWLHSRESLVIHESASLFLTQHSADFLQHVNRLTECCGLSSVNGHRWALPAPSRPLSISSSGRDTYCSQGCAVESGAGAAVLTACLAFTSYNDWFSICHDTAFPSLCPSLGWWLECLFLGIVKIIHRRVYSVKFTLISLAQQESWEEYVCEDFKENLLWKVSLKGRMRWTLIYPSSISTLWGVLK